jgi:D-sedoheptulose 7-phosphate isomerase
VTSSDDDDVARVRGAIEEGIALRRELGESAEQIARAGRRVAEALAAGNTIFLCGNGGSAADSQHIAAELVGRFSSQPRKGLRAIALTTDTSAITAIANDLGYEEVFARQLEALAKTGDVLIAISTSGKSPNVLRALAQAHALGLYVIALTGPAASPLGEAADLTIRAPGPSTDRIQELHISIGHILCAVAERRLLDKRS